MTGERLAIKVVLILGLVQENTLSLSGALKSQILVFP